jgi:hypothetical protein
MAKNKAGKKTQKGYKPPKPQRKDFMRDMKKGARPPSVGRPKK